MFGSTHFGSYKYVIVSISLISLISMCIKKIINKTNIISKSIVYKQGNRGHDKGLVAVH